MRGTLELRGHRGLGALRGSGQQRGTAALGARGRAIGGGAGEPPGAERGRRGRSGGRRRRSIALAGRGGTSGPAGKLPIEASGQPLPRRGRGRQPRPGSTAPGPGQQRRRGRPGRGARGRGCPAGEARAAGGRAAPPADTALPPGRAGPERPLHGAGECPGEETGEGPRGRRAGDAKPLPSTAILPASHSAPAADPAPAALPRPPPRPRGLRSSAAAAINLQRSLTAGGAAPRIPGKRSPGKPAPGQAAAFRATGGAAGRLSVCPPGRESSTGAAGGCGRHQRWEPHEACVGEGLRAPCPRNLHFASLGCFSPGFQSSQTCRLTAPG